MKRSKRKMLTYLTMLSIHSGCATAPQPTKFEGKWFFVEGVEGACLSKEDVKKLLELINQRKK